MRGLFVQTDQPTQGALRAVKAGRREGEVLVAAFDGTPELVDLIKKGEVVGSGMQQPYLMGAEIGRGAGGASRRQDAGRRPRCRSSRSPARTSPSCCRRSRQTVFANELT